MLHASPYQKFTTLIIASGLLLLNAFGAGANTLETVEAGRVEGNKQTFTLKFKEAVSGLPMHFMTSNPNRIVLDFAGTDTPLGRVTEKVDGGLMRGYNVLVAGERTRVVIDLASAANYTLQAAQNALLVQITGPEAAAQTSAIAEAAARKPEATAPYGIRDINFRRGQNGEGRIEVRMSEPGSAIDIKQKGQTIQVDFLDTSLPRKLQQRLDVSDFATPAQSIETTQQKNLTRMVIQPKGQWDFFSYQTGNDFVIEVRPIEQERGRFGATQQARYGGEKLTLDFQNTPIRQLLYVIGEFTGKNLVINDSVTGDITIKLKDVPWDQALDIILRQKGLDKRETGSVMLIAPMAELQAKEKAELEARLQAEQLADLVSIAVKLNYARADEVVKMLKSSGGGSSGGGAAGGGATSGGGSMLSPRGSVSSDLKTNTLFIKDTPTALQNIEELIKALDVPVRQVMIEARIVNATDDFSRSLGARLRDSMSWSGGNKTLGMNTGAALASNNVSLSLFNAGATQTLTLEILASEADGLSKTVSNPRIVTGNLQAATISSGKKIPYQTTSADGTKTEFQDATLSLNVTPQILNNDEVILDVNVTDDSAGAGDVPQISTNAIKTQVRMRTGETIMLGGIYKQDNSAKSNKIPLLGDIPVLGWLFKDETKIDSKSELLIFITPRILQDTPAK